MILPRHRTSDIHEIGDTDAIPSHWPFTRSPDLLWPVFRHFSTWTDLCCPFSTFLFAGFPPFHHQPSRLPSSPTFCNPFFNLPLWDPTFLDVPPPAIPSIPSSHSIRQPVHSKVRWFYDYSRRSPWSGVTIMVVGNEETCGFGSRHDGGQKVK
jgi:hypothetical protein